MWNTPRVVSPGRNLPAWLVGGGAIAAAIGVMNVATYGFTLLAARLLGPQAYGALASLMATLLVISVLQLGLQATAARRISAEPDHAGQIEVSILRVTRRAALAVGFVLLLLSPVVDRVLRLDDLPAAVLVAVAAVPMTMMGGQAGVLQGERRWLPLSLVYVANGVPRLLIGLVLITWHPTEMSAMVGVVIGQVAPVVVGWLALRGHVRAEGRVSEAHRARAVVREAAHNSQALLAFFTLSNADVIVARNVLDGHEAGLYAGGLIMTKAVLFLPQFVVVVAFPAMASAGERRRALTRSLGAVAVIGVTATAGAMALSGLAMVFIGGNEYSEIESRLWLFAVLGTALSMLQLLVYAVLARRGQRSVYLVWGALAALVLLGSRADTLEGLLQVVMTVDIALLVVLVAVSLYLMRDEAAALAAEQRQPTE
jgi:O-antigen/teichoic acid export membrane protein